MNLLTTIQKTFLLVLLIGSFSCSYLPEPIAEEPNLILEENADYIQLTTAVTDNSKAGIIFYPGGLVDPHAYINALKALALEDDRTVVIVKAASNLAILNSQKASAIANEITTINKWIIGGHSLGGSVSCIDVFNNPDDFEAMFLLAAYSTSDLSDSTLPMISITASNDTVLDNEKFNDNKINLPEGIMITTPDEIPNESTLGSTIYYEIAGGNHAQFGNYGNQEGDGTTTIDTDTQQSLVTAALRNFLSSNNL